jgi:hypothetical protein
MDKTQEALERLLIHRLARENKVLNAVRQAGGATLDALVPVVYDDVQPRLYPMASRSLLAHLIKLKADGKVVEIQSKWNAA